MEIQAILMGGNRCSATFNGELKIKIYKTAVIPLVLYSCET